MHKIAFHLNSMEQGGAERVVSNLANRFAREGYEVLVATEWYGKREFALDPRIRRVHVGLTERDEKRSRVGKILCRTAYLRRFIKKERPDVLVAFTHTPNYRALMAGIGTGVPVVISVRTDPTGHYDRRADKLQIPLLFPRAAGCVFQTEGAKAFFAPYLQENSRIILNPLHPKYADAPAAPERKKEVVQSGRIVDFKNQPMLIRAFLKVHQKHPEYVLKLYGPDSGDGTWQILESLIAENHAEDCVKLMGGSDALEKELACASVYAFSSDWEGLPNALMEAMALGLPVVSTDCPCGGPRTLITDGEDGLLVPIMDEEAMAAGINRLIEDRAFAERLGQRARKIRERANEDAVFLQWREYLEECSRK
ncbi:MAG: glycosyltransferase [Eubacteriales bacterium]|nr:glycosyltransferase [Eubacteriales bacterium]